MKQFNISTSSNHHDFILNGKLNRHTEPNHREDAEALFTILCGCVSSVVYNEVFQMMQEWDNIEEDLGGGFFEKYWEKKNNDG